MAVAQSKRNLLVELANDTSLSVLSRRSEKDCASSIPSFHGSREAEEDNRAIRSSNLTAASGIISSLLLRMDGDPKDDPLPTPGPTSSCSSQIDAVVARKLPSTDILCRSGLNSYFTSVPFSDVQSTSRNSLENDDTGSSSISVLSAATTYQSSRGPTTSHSSGNYQLEDDLSGCFNESGRQAASRPTTSAGKDSLAKGDVTFKDDGHEDDASDGQPKGRPSSDFFYSRHRQSLPVAIPTDISHLSNASLLLSEWNDSPFVSSYPNQNQQFAETCTDEWFSEGLPWHIDLQNVVTGDMVATGSYGMVFKGIYKEEKVAVKVLLIPEASSKNELNKLQANFRQEIDLWYNLSHLNVVQFIGAYIGHPKWAIITEFLHGGSLKAYLLRQQRRRLATATIYSMALDIARKAKCVRLVDGLNRGMEYLHKNRIMHRDLKTANLLLDENGMVKVADFGLARFEAEDPGNLTAETGTIRWMAPEVICHLPYTRKIDVYSYGIVLWELCTSLVPYEGMSFVQLAHAVANDHHRPPTSDLPTFFVNLMRQCWDKDTTGRPDFSAIITYLETGFAGGYKVLSKSGYKSARSDLEAPTDIYSRPTISMRGGQVVGQTRNTGPSYVANTENTLSDDEDWLSIKRQCRCTIM